MNITFYVHMEPVEHDIAWWAEAEALPGLSVAASTLRELRVLIEEAVQQQAGQDSEISLELVAESAESDSNAHALPGTPEADLQVSATPHVRRTPVFPVALVA